MPRASDDDLPRWEPPEPIDDAPRWEGPPPSADVPHWAPPSAPAEVVRRREPEWRARRQPSRGATRPRVAPRTGPSTARAPQPHIAPAAVPFVWWGRHAWVIVWALVILAPVGVLLLRLLDDAGYEALVTPFGWALAALFVTTLLVAALASARRSATRLTLGVAAALVAVLLVLWPSLRVTFGRTQCPARAGVDLGVSAAVSALHAWQRGAAGGAVWRGGTADAAWRERTREGRLLDYQLVESGCWARLAPVDGTRTWHEFRVTVESAAQDPLSKVVILRTVAEGGEWKIESAEWPLP